ncbi:phage tail tape measure protein [Pseudoalteromonas arctica]|uniref:Phage tail tape measure protein n=1 Tax=Pseudoalteromonas arctica TaxID=394751 RepID=A0A7Y0HCU6_9GAMM|nr:phage tail tape measure protein [Pseudoalteromonas arctica]NMM40464.1 phage tail tape measure protein [Pseudoalteromonas arctica]
MATLSKLDKLTYSIGIIDKVTGPVNKVMAKINQLSQQTAAAQEQMMRGAATAVGGGYALAKSLAPAIDHVAALGEVQSLGVADDALQKLTKTSYEFGFQFGGNSAEFVRSAYDIQSAIAGLTGDELSEFTKTSNILAVATKADAATITSYMGTMYGIFEKTANKMGKANWVNQIAGQTATAVQLYKTTGAEMQAAFSNLGATATNIGLSSAQQFALVGELQLVAKSGSVAGTQAASLLQGIGKAQDALGIKLTADNGDMLAIDVVLGRINNRLSSLGSVARGDVLTQIFGKQGAKAVDVLSTKVDKLKDGITVFENVQDNSKALEMANIIASPWDRLGGSFNAAATAMGNRLLPVVEPFVEMLAAGFAGIVSLTERFPVLSSALATLIVGVVGVVTVFGLLNFSMGLLKFSGLTLAPVLGGLKYATGLYTKANTALFLSLNTTTKATQGATLANKIYTAVMARATLAQSRFNTTAAFTGGYIPAIGAYAKGAVASISKFAMGLFNVTRIMHFLNVALLANPIGIIIGLVVLLAALIYKFWQPIKAFMSGFWDGFVHSFSPVIEVFSELGAAFSPIINAVKSVFSWFASLFTPVEQSSQALEGVTSAGEVFGLVFGAALNLILFPIKAVIWFITKLVNGITWIASAISDMWSAVKTPLSSFFDFIKTVFGYSPMGMMMKGYGKAFDWLSEKVGGLKGIADSIKGFFGFGDDETEIKATKVTQAAQPKTMGMQNADQAYSRDYGQGVISKANAPAEQASSQYIAPNSPVNYAAPKVATLTETENVRVISKANAPAEQASPQYIAPNSPVNYAAPKVTTLTETENVRVVAAANQAANDPVYSAQPKAMTEREAANDAFKFTIQRLPAVPTDTTAPLNLQAQARSQTLINNAFPSVKNNAVTTNASGGANSTSATTANINNSAINSAFQNSTANSFTNAANSPLQPLPTTKTDQAITNTENSSVINSALGLQGNSAVNKMNYTLAPTNQATNSYAAANDITANAVNKTASRTATNNYVGHSEQSTPFAPQSALQNTVNSTANNFTNAANLPVFSSTQVQLSGVNQTVSPLQPLPTAKTDQAITNVANAGAYKVDQLSTEQQQQSNSYKAKVQKSAFLQNLTSNTDNSSSSDSDNRKSVHIDSLTIKSDDVAQSFEQMMELAG